MKKITITFAILLLVGFNLFAQKNQIEAIKKILPSVNQEEAILQIKNELIAIQHHYEASKNYDNRFQKAKNIKLLAYSIEEAYTKLKPIIESHYVYLVNNNPYGLANNQCFIIKKQISGNAYYESPIFELLDDIKSAATHIIERKEGTSWIASYSFIFNDQIELLKKNKYIQKGLKSILEFQPLDESRTEAERRLILIKKKAEIRQKYFDAKYGNDD